MLLSVLINRLDLSSLERIIGKEVLDTIQFESGPLLPSKLKEILTSETSLPSILENADKVNLLLDFLKDVELKELSIVLRCNEDEIKKNVQEVYKSGDLFKVYSFFESSYETIPKTVLPRTEEVIPARGMREYQTALLKEFKKFFSEKNGQRVLLHLPTGAGKTRLAIRFLCEQMAVSNCNFLWMANDTRLLRQAEEEFRKTWEYIGDSESKICRVDRNLKEDDLKNLHKTGFFCTAQTYYEMIKRQDPIYKHLAKSANITVFDEAHRVTAKTYEDTVETICFYSEGFLIGLSATPGRSTLNLDEDRRLKNFFGNSKIKLSTAELGYSNPFQYLIDKKFLAKPSFTKLEYDDSKISKVNFLHKKLKELSERYKKILVFCESIEETDTLASSLRFSVPFAYSVHSKNTENLNQTAINKLRDKSLTSPVILINAEMLTTGFDAPGIDCVVIAKKCDSVITFSQMVGRGLRGPFSGGSEEVMIFHIQNQSHEFYFDLNMMFNYWEGVWDE